MPRELDAVRFIGRTARPLALVGRTGSAACGSDDETQPAAAPRQSERGRAGRRGQPPERRLRAARLLQLAALHRQEGASRASRRPSGVELKYIEDINDNTEFFGKVRQPLERGDGIGRDLVALTDWMAGRWIRLDYVEPIDKKNIPNVEEPPRPTCVDVNFDKGRKFTMPWQSGMTAIGYNTQGGRRGHDAQAALRPEVQGQGVAVLRRARHHRARDAHGGQEARGGDDRRHPGGGREGRGAEPQRPDPPLHRQRLHDRPDQRQRRDGHGLLGRHDPAEGRQPRPRLRHPRGGRDPLVGQHDDPAEGRARPTARRRS